MKTGATTLALVLVLAGCVPGDAPPSGSGHAVPPTTTDTAGCWIDRVVDGDTVHARCDSGVAGNLRLVGFDTPETFKPGCTRERQLGQRAKTRLRQELDNARTIRTQTLGRDRYGRLLTRLYLDGTDIADIMVDAGLAVRYDGGKRIDWCTLL